jgi:DNA-binding transcriptional ArsR family regulator
MRKRAQAPAGARRGELDGFLLALADPTRRGVVELLRRRPHRAGELAAAFRMPAPAMSRHLRVLRVHGLIEDARVEHDARVRLFQLRREPFAALARWLAEIEAAWSSQLAAFKAHAERRRP